VYLLCDAGRQRALDSSFVATDKKAIMKISGIPFGVTDWSQVERTEHKGETGTAYWQMRVFGGIRVRVVEYSPGYLAQA
jgi:hypothetical protein